MALNESQLQANHMAGEVAMSIHFGPIRFSEGRLLNLGSPRDYSGGKAPNFPLFFGEQTK